MVNEYKYLAFISYKREDEKWAKWLQHKMEHYKLPTPLRKTDQSLPERVRPVFMDITDLAGGVLEKAIKEALRSSKYLIVICTPRAAQSPWVCLEVQEFIDSGREEYIIPFIIDGEPNSSNITTECFPQNLKGLTGSRELLGININENGRDAAAVKVIARMFNLKFDVLWQRFQRSQRKSRRLMFFVFLIVFMIVTSVTIWIGLQNIKLEEQKKQIEQNELQLSQQLEISKQQADSLKFLNIELQKANLHLETMIDSLVNSKRTITRFMHENKLLKDENEKLRQQTYIDMKNELNDNDIQFGL